jgi:hypothetical protein
MQADLHVHSRHSTRPSQWFLQKIGCPESFTEPLHLYHIARRRGMTLVTITDHNKIDGALEIAHLPGVFISEEVTSYFPEDGCKIHVLVYNIDEAQHAEIQRLRANLYDLVAYLKQAGITCAVAHALYSVNDRLTPEHVEKLLLLFSVFELNGDGSPAANRCIEEVAARLTPDDIERMAAKHKLEPIWPEPWVKRLIGGSDDHSSLNIARNFTRVEGAASVAEFLDGIRQGRAQAVQRPSSPQNIAHNLYSIAYQFYRHKLDLGRQVPHDFLLRYVDRSLRFAEEEDAGLLSRLHLLWRYPRLRKIKGSLPAPLVELLRKETTRLIQEEPDLFVLPRKGDWVSQQVENRWFEFIDKMSSRILRGFANHLLDHFSGANLFSIFHTIGSAGGFCTLLAPYFVGFSHHNAQRELARSVMDRFVRRPDAGQAASCAVFAETLAEAGGAAVFSAGDVAAADGVVLTCDAVTAPGVHTFTPIGTYEFSDLPGHRLSYPPVLEMLDYCFKHDTRRIHLAGAGPTALAGLFIGRFLNLPVEATYSDLLPRLARTLTHDGFIEDLTWKYLVWFYNQIKTVLVPGSTTAGDLEEKGVAPEKLRVFTPATRSPETDRPMAAGEGFPADGLPLRYGSRRSLI